MIRPTPTPLSRLQRLQGNLPAIGAALLVSATVGCSGSSDDGDTDPDPDPGPPAPELVGGLFALTNRHDNSIQLLSEGATDTPDVTPAGNEIVAYRRFDDGSLELAGMFSTAEEGEETIGENIRNSGANPLASQDPLILSELEDGSRVLFAVNAGSDSVSSLRVNEEDMTLTHVSTVPTVGPMLDMQNPVSLTECNGVLYVLNSGAFFDADETTPLDFVPAEVAGTSTEPSLRHRRQSGIIGFTIGEDGSLTFLEGSEMTQNFFGGSEGTGPIGPGNGSLGANGGSIDFSTEGNALYITERRTDSIVTIMLNEDMLPTAMGANLDSSIDQPFGTDVVTTTSGTEVLLVSQGNNGIAGLSGLSSFTIGEDGSLTPASLAMGVEGDPFITGFNFGCWVETFIGANTLTYAYTANTPNGTLTGYQVNEDGTLRRLSDPMEGGEFPNIPETGNVGGVGVLDTEIVDGGFLYQVVNVGDPADETNNSRIAVFQVQGGGSLMALPDLDTENELFVPRQFVGVAGF